MGDCGGDGPGRAAGAARADRTPGGTGGGATREFELSDTTPQLYSCCTMRSTRANAVPSPAFGRILRTLALPLALALALAAIWAGKPVQAQDGPGLTPVERAMALFERSETLFQEGRFDEAAVLLQQAYELEPEPILLYNLGRCLDADGDKEGAIEAFERYLVADPDAENRGAIERQIENLQQAIAEREALEEDLATRHETAAPTATAQDVEGPSPWPWVIAGVGVAAVGAGLAIGMVARGAHDDAVAEPVHREAVASQDRAEELATVSTIAMAAGGAIVAVGLGWVLLDGGGGEPGAEGRSAASARLGVGPGCIILDGRF